ncbi:SLC13/DASS family transporter, partial [bacterium]
MRRSLRLIPLLGGLALFVALAAMPSLPDVTDPQGQIVSLSPHGQAALGLFLLAGVWWIFEVIPVGVTAIVIGVIQSLWLIRDPRTALTDFMDPSVWFIFGSLIMGMAFHRTGLTQRLAYKMLTHIPEKTRAIYLGVFAMTAALTLVMAHTAVAAAIFPLVLVVHHLYEPRGRRTRFGKGLFIGMAWTAGAGSVITLLGAARGAVAIGFYREFTGEEITFWDLTYHMAPLGVVMVLLLWGYVCIAFKPERDELPGLRDVARQRYAKLGPPTRKEWATLLLAIATVAILTLRSFVPALAPVSKSAVVLGVAVLFFIGEVLPLKDLEKIPWN